MTDGASDAASAVSSVSTPTAKATAAFGSILYLDGVTVSFDGFRALNDLSLVIAPGELRAIIGPNGAGKTTMMDVITARLALTLARSSMTAVPT